MEAVRYAAGEAVGASKGSSLLSLGLGGLCIAIGGIVVVGIFTDWEEVEISGIFKLKRKAKQA